MNIVVNGDRCELPAPLTIRELLEHIGLGGGLVAVEVNRAIVLRADHPRHLLAEGDVVEIVQLVGGG